MGVSRNPFTGCHDIATGASVPCPKNSTAKTTMSGAKSSATGATTTTTTVATTDYTTMALYVIGGGAVGYAGGHFGLKGKKIAGLEGLHLNLALAVIGAGIGYFVYNQQNS